MFSVKKLFELVVYGRETRYEDQVVFNTVCV